MSDQPKSGEWTAKRLERIAHCELTPLVSAFIIDAHDAALAKARLEAHNYWSQAVDSAQQQLDAERERYTSLEKSILDLSHPNYKDLLQQLASEREKVQTYEGALIKIANDPNCDRCQVAVDALAKVAK